jgi:large subunit ribosomal protein L29
MTMATASELRQYADDELFRHLEETKAELFNLRFQIVTGQMTNVSRISRLRKEVARVLTLVRQREIELSKEEG